MLLPNRCSFFLLIAEEYAKETFYKKKDAEKEMYDKIQEEKRAAEPDVSDSSFATNEV